MTYNPYPYSMYPNTYMSYAQQPTQYNQPSGTSQTAPQTQTGILWVDGEVGAKAYQLPSGWPANTPMPLWDTNDTIIYLKSTNPMGMPNPLQKIHYTMEESAQMQSTPMMRSAAPALMSGDDGPQYVTKDDLDRMKDELRKTISDAMKDRDQQTYTTKGGRSNESAV